MFLSSINLQNFRNYKQASFEFSEQTTVIVGPNTSGKTNLTEAVYYLAFGKSNRSDNNENSIKIGEEIAKVMGKTDISELEVILASGSLTGKDMFKKRYLINGVSKRRIDFMGNIFCVLFSPIDLEIIIGSPNKRREFLNEALIQTDREYRLAEINFEKGLRQRNALLQRTKESGIRQEKEFEYWDNLLIDNGSVITKKREQFIKFMNDQTKEVFNFIIDYDKSIISQERLLQYKDAEVGAGVTLVGPHRDDFLVQMYSVCHPEFISGSQYKEIPKQVRNDRSQELMDVKIFGSRGQQRLVVLQLKLLQLLYMKNRLGFKPLFLLDDIFSELDEDHISLVLEKTLLSQGYGGQGQTIMTTTHEEFIPKRLLPKVEIIKLDKT